VTVTTIGSVTIPTLTGPLKINEVYHCPGVDGIILSTGRLLSEGWKLVYDGTQATLFDPLNNKYDTVFHNYCWSLRTSSLQSKKVTQVPSFDPYIWHIRLGHVSDKVVKDFLRINYPDKKISWKPFFCEQCAKSKSLDKKTLGMETLIPRDKPLDLCVSDVIGPLNLDINGCRFLVTLRDHASTYTFCAPMASRAEVPAKIMKWLRHFKTTLGRAPAYLRCDNALEYIKSLKPQLESVGTILAPVTPYSPEQNGEAE
jgi:hypothetical protein